MSQNDSDEIIIEKGVICYLTVYKTMQTYGGPQEGGWWYTTYSPECWIPFRATLYRKGRLITGDPDDPYRYAYRNDMLSSYLYSGADGQDYISVADEIKFDRLNEVNAEESRLREMYGPDVEIHKEWIPGLRSHLARPIYC